MPRRTHKATKGYVPAIVVTTVLAGAVGLGSVTAPVDAADLGNAGFEGGLTGWSALAGTTLSVVQSPVHGGSNAAAIRRTKASGPAALTDSPDAFTGLPSGAACTATAWVYGPVGYKVTQKLIAKNGTSTVKSVTKTTSFTGSWQQLPVISLTVPADGLTADLQFSAPTFPLAQTWYLDDVSATCGATTPPPPPPPPPAGPAPVDRAVEAGLYDGKPFPTYGAFPADYDNDGLLDVLINPHNVTGGPRLYHNDGGGHFTEVGKGQFVSKSPSGVVRNDRHGCAWGDVDNNGYQDLFCTMGANHGTVTDKANELWLQQPGGGFVNAAADYGVTDPIGPGRTAVFLDVNHDGYLDLYVTNHYRSDGLESPNHLYLNQNGASYVDSPEYGLDVELGGLPGNQGPAQAVDFNHDGWDDLFVVGHLGLKLYRNDGGTGFTDVTSSSGLVTGTWRYAVIQDVNGDGWADVIGFNAGGTLFRIQLGSATTFGPAVATRTVAAGQQVAVGDMNGDSKPDVYVVTGDTNPDILLLGDGSGRQFVPSAPPPTTTGKGQSVSAFDYDQNGVMDMIVGNGDSTNGPVQLITIPTS